MRIRIDSRSTDLIDSLTRLYDFKLDGIITRIAFAYSLQLNKRFDLNEEFTLGSDGRDWRDERTLFGVSADEKPYFMVYKAMIDQHYGMVLSEEMFIKLFKAHLNFALEKMDADLKDKNIASGYHISYLMKIVKNGLDLIDNKKPVTPIIPKTQNIPAYEGVVEITLGKNEQGQNVSLRINDLKEFDSCNIAVAGMVGSGKTELIKDLLYQISANTEKNLKFIFFDYKGEGNPDRLSQFFDLTGSKMVDLKKAPMALNPLSFINLDNERAKLFNIKSFVDFVCTIATSLGSLQKHILQQIISEAYENTQQHPTLNDLHERLLAHYEENGIKADTLLSIISDLATSIFTSDAAVGNKKIYSESLYVNLPMELSDTLRQLCVFLTLKYLLAEFSSTNDTEPDENRIKPLRYIIVIDEAHVYLKNKNASKALEDILRVLRSKGVVTIMLTQGVEDYKTKNFDFASQIKIPVCLNINNKDFKLIENFVGTSRSKQKLQEAINKLEPGKGVINLSEPQVITINQFWKTQKGSN
jgi:DNA sulfur modification protein DndE